MKDIAEYIAGAYHLPSCTCRDYLWPRRTLTIFLRLLPVCPPCCSLPDLFFADVQDRLATLSASEALQRLTSGSSKSISTGLSRVDALLQNREIDSSSQDSLNGGLTRGHVTEVYGPPGVGKSTFAWVLPHQNEGHPKTLVGRGFPSG